MQEVNLHTLNEQIEYDSYGVFFATDILTHDDVISMEDMAVKEGDEIFLLFSDAGFDLGTFLYEDEDWGYYIKKIINNAYVDMYYDFEDNDYLNSMNDAVEDLKENNTELTDLIVSKLPFNS